MKMSYAYERRPSAATGASSRASARPHLVAPVPSGHARRESSIAAHNTAAYMQHADALLKAGSLDSAERSSPPAEVSHTTAPADQIGKAKRPVAQNTELWNCSVGTCRIRPMGHRVALGTAFGMALRRHPHLHDRVRKAYEMAEYWVPDPWLIRTARDMLPPLDGSWRDFVGTEGGKAVRNREGVDQRVLDDVEAGSGSRV